MQENTLPIPPQVKGACGLLGLDPLYVANEGILIAILASVDAHAVVTAMKQHPYGQRAVIIGDVTTAPSGMVLLETAIGGSRIIDMLQGEQLPRIC
jgi:hydrogenase expression/formation protein HypE